MTAVPASLTCHSGATYRLKRTVFEEASMVAREPATPGPAASSARSFPLIAWYAAFWCHMIKREMTTRTIWNKDIVLYMLSDGQVVALEDACWNLHLPLSLS